ncbi:hypothetical protein NB703_000329 [Pantoea ananatis]|uniref:Fimbrial protein n=2 Tax=Pantoea ananas TaxID=553 RepID=A0AAJ1FPY8_PANAN|nr:hypothetical protein [Pantoea ananatis]MCW0342236.1 hypothetical protein [Pantoea ananatis]QZE28256.1 hypothetical protein K4732_15190 [Pantoea ananatis]
MNKYRATLVAVLIAISGSANAATFQWPVATRATWTHEYASFAQVWVGWTAVTINDEAIHEKDTIADVLARHGMDAAGGVTTGATAVGPWQDGSTYASEPIGQRVSGKGTDNFLKYAKKVSAALSGTVQMAQILNYGTLTTPDVACLPNGITTLLKEGSVKGSVTEVLQGILSETWNPAGANCAALPPAASWCALETATANFDFGVLQAEEFAGARKSNNIAVRCTGSVAYKLSTGSSSDQIMLSNGGSGVITIDDGSLGRTLTGRAGTNSLSLAITLQRRDGVSLKSGGFSGNAVLYVTYP